GPFYKNWSLDTFIEKMNQLSLPTGKKLEVMSKGEFFRFQLAFGMAHQARLYLMDEITGGMDVVFRSDFFKLVKAEILEAGASAILITHIEEEIVRQVDFVGIMEAGRLISYQEAWVE
ncbi:MAG: type transport system ATP-binding protein, partial [Clostridiales bacterium]|nr:type transport system ATP-binding protein [Clostridiales bacterium]